MCKRNNKAEIKAKAAMSWNIDLEDLERALGVVDPVNTLEPTKIDGRVPPRGSVLWDRVAYLPDDK